MTERERFRRPVPDRVEPDRHWNGLFGPRGDDADLPPADPGAAPSSEGRDAAFEAINSAYKVIDDYMRQGQRLAEQFWLPSNGAGPHAGHLFERLLRSAGDRGTAWLDLLGQLSAPSDRRASPRGTAGPFAAGRVDTPSEAGEKASHGARLCISVEASRRFEVSIDLGDPSDASDLQLYELASSDRSLPPLRDIEVSARLADGSIRVRVRVPDDHPAGIYNGLLTARVTQQPRGTVSLTLE